LIYLKKRSQGAYGTSAQADSPALVLATKRKPRALFVYKNERRDVSVLIKRVSNPFN
jgi:hypothetical protein